MSTQVSVPGQQTAARPFHLLRLQSANRQRRQVLEAQLEELPEIAANTGHTATLTRAKAELAQLTLEERLLAVGVPVFTTESVAAYKAQLAAVGSEETAALQAEVAVAESLIATAINDTKRETTSENKEALEGSVYLYFLSACILVGLLGYTFGGGIGVAVGGVALILSVFVAGYFGDGPSFTMLSKRLLASLPAKCASLQARASEIKRYSWQQIPMEQFGESIPITVLRRANLVRETIPQAMFLVEQLCVGPATVETNTALWTWTPPEPEFDEDPFLLVKVGESTAYIGVWEESEYEVEIVK